MDSLTGLVESAGAVNVINLILLVVLIVAVVVLLRERNTGDDRKRDDEFRKLLVETLVGQSAVQNASLDRLTNEFRRVFDILVEEQRLSRAMQERFVETTQEFKEKEVQDKIYREALSQQLATDMADNKLAIETNTAQLLATKQELKAAQGELAMTTDELKGMKTQMDLFNVTLESMDKKLASIETTDEGMRGAMEVLRLEVVNLRDLLNNIITMIEHGKTSDETGE